MNRIQAIETHYNGYRFRSRLEARWAVFFDAVGLRWRYESEGFEIHSAGVPLPVCRYLPDFHLLDWDIFLEVKPDLPYEDFQADTNDNVFLGFTFRGTYTAMGKFVMASHELQEQKGRVTKPRLYMACGVPGKPDLLNYKGRWKLKDGAAILSAMHTPADGSIFTIEAFSEADGVKLVDIWPYYLNGDVREGAKECEVANFPRGTQLRLYVGGGRSFATPKLMNAYRAARSARFEHGERPTI